jgi:hypothetical protein
MISMSQGSALMEVRPIPLCPYLAGLELAPTTAKYGDEKKLRALASVDMVWDDAARGRLKGMRLADDWTSDMDRGRRTRQPLTTTGRMEKPASCWVKGASLCFAAEHDVGWPRSRGLISRGTTFPSGNRRRNALRGSTGIARLLTFG